MATETQVTFKDIIAKPGSDCIHYNRNTDHCGLFGGECSHLDEGNPLNTCENYQKERQGQGGDDR